jgi:hypothetical protein
MGPSYFLIGLGLFVIRMLSAELAELHFNDLLLYVFSFVRGVVLIFADFAPQSNYVSFDLRHKWDW